MDKLAAQYAVPAIPADAFCAEEFGKKTGRCTKQAGDILREVEKVGGLKRAFGKKGDDKRARCWYWPASLG